MILAIRRLILFVVLVFVSNLALCQNLESTWLFEQDRFFQFTNPIQFKGTEIKSKRFDFIREYQIQGDSLFFRHGYDTTKKCAGVNKKGELIDVRCSYDSIPDSKFLIAKHTSDSLFIIPINNSAKAISAKISRPFFESIKKIAEDPYAKGIAYLDTLRLYNSKTLFEVISWDTLAYSFISPGYFDADYFDIKITRDGSLFAIKRHVPYRERKPTKENRTKMSYYKGKLPDEYIQMITSELNNSGVRRIDAGKIKGWSTHGLHVTLKIAMPNQTQLFSADSESYPFTLKKLIRELAGLHNSTSLKTSDQQFHIETSFYKKKK